MSVMAIVDVLLAVSLATELIVPLFVWRRLLPQSVTNITQIALAAAAAMAYFEMMRRRKIAAGFGAILAFSVIGCTVALFRGQSVLATLWGWWETYKFPLLGLYAYLRLGWPQGLPRRLVSWLLAIMVVQIVAQAWEYTSGVRPASDNVSGTFGRGGVVSLFFFSCFVLSVSLGEWLAHRRWRPLFWALVLGTVSGVLAANKFFPVAAVLMTALAILLNLIRGTSLWRASVLMALLGVVVMAFSVGYDTLTARGSSTFADFFLDEERRSAYLNPVKRSRYSTDYVLGRGASLGYALTSIGEDPVTYLFGFGLGARRESKALGVVGTALAQDRYIRGVDLVVLLQEMGMFSAAAVGGFVLWVTLALFRENRKRPRSPCAPLRYALILFSLMWPIWLWYKSPIIQPIPMYLYWGSLGYVFGEASSSAGEIAVQA